MNQLKALTKCSLTAGLTLFMALMLGCAAKSHEHEQATNSPLVPTGHGTVTLDDAYEFEPPPEGCELLRDLGDGETVFMFYKLEKGDYPSQTSYFYNDKVYGNALELEERVDQFMVYYLAGTGMKTRITKTEDGMIDGREALVVHMEGTNPYRNEKVKAVAYFYKLGQYIVSLACTQWRAMDGEFDPKPFQTFEAFTKSFKYVKKPFYEEIEERIQALNQL